jgi:hypothetical protein
MAAIKVPLEAYLLTMRPGEVEDCVLQRQQPQST